MRDEVAAAKAKREFLLSNYKEVEGKLETKCWRWMRACDWAGYGVLSYKDINYSAHRIAWVLAKGPIPKGLLCLHRCDFPSCINVKHLFVDTQMRNIEDMIAKGRKVVVRGEQVGTAILSDADTANVKGLLLQDRRPGIIPEIARRYSALKGRNVSRMAIADIARGKNGRHIEPSPNPVMPPMPGLKIKRRGGL